MCSEINAFCQNGGMHLRASKYALIVHAHMIYTDIVLQACSAGCRYFLKGPPDYYVGEKDIKKGVRG